MSTATTAPRASERRHALPQLPPDDAAPAAPARQKFVKLDDDVADVLRGASCSGANLKLGGQLDRKLYQRTMKVLEQLGGDWNRKLQCHVFPSEAKPLIDAALGDGKVLNRQQSYQFFETPPDVAMRVAQLAAIGPGMTVLEPSAGRGAIATAVFAAQPLADLYMVEIDPTHRDALDGIAGEEAVRIGDFLALPADALVPDPSGFDRVVMNPPFSGGQDADHVLRAFSLLKPGGRLVAIVGTGILSRTDKRAVAFQDFLAEHAAAAEDHELPAGTFADTDVATRIVVIDKPTAARAAVAPGEPADAQVHADDAATEAAPPPPETPPADWFQEIPLDRIHESKTNPRKSFRGLEELAASISQKGVIQPVLVRPTGETTGGRVVFKPTAETLANAPGLRDSMTFELVAGARRYRASQLAGAATIPAMVRILDDKSVEEIQTIENDQREDVRPLEQAEGYQRLIEHHGYDVAALALKTGRPADYIRGRLQLLKLVPQAREWLEAETIGLGHAVLIARLDAKQQERLLKDYLFQSIDYHGAPPLKRLRDKIEGLFHLNLKSALFPKDDATLVEKAGSCTSCPKRTGNSRELWADVAKDDTCTDPACYKAKQRAFVQVQVKKAEAKARDVIRISANSYHDKKGVLGRQSYEVVSAKEAKKAKAGTLKTAVVVDGSDGSPYGDGPKLGAVVQIRLKPGATGSPGPSREDDWKKRQEREERDRKVGAACRVAIATAVDAKLAAAGGPSCADLVQILEEQWCSQNTAALPLIEQAYGWESAGWREVEPRLKSMSRDELVALLVRHHLLSLGSQYQYPPLKVPQDLQRFAQRHGVDFGAIVRGTKAKLKAEEKATATAKPKPANKARGKTDPDDEDGAPEGGRR